MAMMNNEEGGSPTQKSTQVPMSEVTTLLTFCPVESNHDSTQYFPQRAGSMSLSHTFSPHLERRFFYISNGGMVASAFNLTSATLGAGTLAIPNAVYHSGILLSSIALLVCVISTLYSVYLLAFVIELTGNSTYEEMARYCFGQSFEKATAFIIVMFCWGVAVVYIVVMADILDSIITALHLIPYISRRTAVLLFWFFIMLPLCLGRSINSLRYASLVCTVSTMVLVAAICTHAVENGASLKKVPLIKLERDTLSAFNTFVFSVCCQTVVSRIYSEMKKGNPCRITTAAALSMGLCSFMYILAGTFGAAEFGSQIEANIMHNYTDELEKPYIALAFFAIAVTVTMAFPMTIFPTRDSVLMVLGFTDNINAHISATVSILLAFLALILGLAVPNVRVLFDFLGGVFGGLISFVFPAMFGMRCGFCKPSAVGWPHALATITLFLIGVLSCVLGVCTSFGFV